MTEGSGLFRFQPGRARSEERLVVGNLGGRVLQKAGRSHVPARGRLRRVDEGGERNEEENEEEKEKSMKMNRCFKIVFSFFFFILIKFNASLTYF